MEKWTKAINRADIINEKLGAGTATIADGQLASGLREGPVEELNAALVEGYPVQTPTLCAIATNIAPKLEV